VYNCLIFPQRTILLYLNNLSKPKNDNYSLFLSLSLPLPTSILPIPDTPFPAHRFAKMSSRLDTIQGELAQTKNLREAKDHVIQPLEAQDQTHFTQIPQPKDQTIQLTHAQTPSRQVSIFLPFLFLIPSHLSSSL
jgi:hypothetical protein